MWQSLPIIDKSIVKAHYYDFVNTQFLGRTIMAHTSGTTGSGLTFPLGIDAENRQWAIWWKYRRSLGIELGTWCGWFGGRMIIALERNGTYWRVNVPGRQVMFSSYHLSRSSVRNYWGEIKRRGLTWLHGYPSSISQLARLITDEGLQPIDNVRFITTGAENLYDHQIQQMKRAFPMAMVRTHYGLTEAVANMSQDINGEWHIDDDFCHIDLMSLSPNEPNKCRIIGTGFANLAFPLLRYDTGDIVTVEWVDGKAKILSIDGRQDDYVTLPNGVKLGRLDFLFKGQIHIAEAQIHQHKMDEIELLIVKDLCYSAEDEERLKEDANSRFGNGVNVTITYMDKLQRTQSGKLRLVISDVK